MERISKMNEATLKYVGRMWEMNQIILVHS